jgi:hypothetical protein
VLRHLVLPVISTGAPRHTTWETPISEGQNYGREMAGQFGQWFRLPRKSQGSLTCRTSATWDRWLYFPSEGRHAVDFFGDLFSRKIWRLRLSSILRSWVPEASMLTTTPPKPLMLSVVETCFGSFSMTVLRPYTFLDHMNQWTAVANGIPLCASYCDNYTQQDGNHQDTCKPS